MKSVRMLPSEIGVDKTIDLSGCPLNLNAKNRVNILALGDVGTTMLIGLRLLGSDVISEIGICDIREENISRLEREINQIDYPFGSDMPPVHPVKESELFDCDVLIFCASKGVPPVKPGDAAAAVDVRMVQLEANREIISHYAELAKGYKGFVAVVSDPVDNLCAAFLDASGLEPWQIQGYGLGVMNTRARYYAKSDERLASYLTEGRAFGPHGKDLVIANSVTNYDDELSRELTALTVNANIEIRDLGFKPYIAPALSSAALSILLTMRGEWHFGSLYFGDSEGAYLGIKNRLTPNGWEFEDLPLNDKLYERIKSAYINLCRIR